MEFTCWKCQGSGFVPLSPDKNVVGTANCPICNGVGRLLAIEERKPDGYAVILPDKNAPHGHWFVGACNEYEAAEKMRDSARMNSYIKPFVFIEEETHGPDND